jgi:probable HAF family extracellular repeat protein
MYPRPVSAWPLTGFVVGWLLCSLQFMTPLAWGAPATQYTLTDLGPTTVLALSKSDTTAVGYQTSNGQVIAAQLAPTFRSLGTLPNGLSSRALGASSGRIVGYSFTDRAQHAVLWTDDGGMVDLSVLVGEPRLNTATATNGTDIAGLTTGPVILVKGTSLLELPTPGGANGYIYALNNAGDAVGYTSTPTGHIHCTFWPVSGGVIDCAPPTGGGNSVAKDINNAGQIVGYTDEPGATRGFVWLPQSGMMLLPPMPDATRSEAASINDAGDIVGRSYTPGPCGNCPPSPQAAVLWQNGQPIDLQPSVINGAGWDLVQAISINNDGVIVGRGTLNGQPHSWLLTPTTDVVK